MSLGINGFRVPLERQPAQIIHAGPDVLVRNGIRVGGGDLDPEVREERGGFGRPRFEFAAVRVVLHVAEHEGAQMAVFMGEDVAEAVYVPCQLPVIQLVRRTKMGQGSTFIINDLLCQFNKCMVPVRDCGALIRVLRRADSLAFPIRPPGRRIELFAPDDLNPPGGFRYRRNSSLRNSLVQQGQELLSKGVLLLIKHLPALHRASISFPGTLLARGLPRRFGRREVVIIIIFPNG